VIRAACGPDGAPTFESSVNGISIYLDHFAIKTFAKANNPLRQRFIAALHNGADLLFSVANSLEICGAQGDSAATIKAFLDELGSHWYPVEFSPHLVMDREKAGAMPSRACFAEELLRAFFTDRTSGYTAGSGKVINLYADEFFKLGSFVDWLAPQRDHFRQQIKEFDDTLTTIVAKLRAKHKANPGWLDGALPTPIYNSQTPAKFAHDCLLRELIRDFGFQIKKGDAMDFCHAVMASSFGVFGTLDKHWKRRVENFPKPNRTARIYYEQELEKMMTDIESALDQMKRGVSPITIA
jgi:hypothetical protein